MPLSARSVTITT